MLDAVLEGPSDGVVDDIAGDPSDEEVAQAFIEDDSGVTRESEQVRTCAKGCCSEEISMRRSVD